jgi:hypothetical protein
LGEAGLAEYRRLATGAWQKVKPLRAHDQRAADDEFGVRYQLAAILEDFAERDGDVDARIAIRARTLSSAYSYLGLAQLCLEHDRRDEAVKWAEEGLWQFEDQPDERLVLFAADLYRKIGRGKDAGELLWQTFERLPSIELYRKLKRAVKPGSASQAQIRDRAVAELTAKLAKPDAKARWSEPRELLLEILASEQLLSEAWDVVQRYGCSEARLMALAKASEQSHPDLALSAYAREVERLASLGGDINYQAVRKLIARMQSIRKRLGAEADHAAFLADFMKRHKAKRNLMKLL